MEKGDGRSGAVRQTDRVTTDVIAPATDTFATPESLEAQLDYLRAAPAEVGTVGLVVRRPKTLAREVLDEGVLDVEDGLVGDNWLERATARAIEAGRHYEAQLNVMSHRMVSLLADSPDAQALAGDQLYVDLDISHTNLPPGSRLALGDPADDGAIIEVTKKPHTGCKKFVTRFGEDATTFVNSDEGKELRLRGFNARVVQSGRVRPGDVVRKL